MSRIGRLPVAIPAGVTVEVAENNVVTVKGPKGTLTKELPVEMEIKVEGEEVIVTRPSDLKKMKSLHGLTRTLINNMVVGVTEESRLYLRDRTRSLLKVSIKKKLDSLRLRSEIREDRSHIRARESNMLMK